MTILFLFLINLIPSNATSILVMGTSTPLESALALIEPQKADISILLHPRHKKATPLDISILSRLPESRPRQTLLKTSNTTIVQASLKFPNQKRLHVLAVRLPNRQKFRIEHRQALKKIEHIRRQLPQKDLVMAAGDFGFDPQEDGKENIIERDLQPTWLVAHQMIPPPLSPSNTRREIILFEKGFYDGLKGWKVDRNKTAWVDVGVPPENVWILSTSILEN